MRTIGAILQDPHGKPARRGPIGRRGAIGVLTIALDWVLRSLEVARQRRALQALDDRMLKDVGLTRADVEREASKPFWRLEA